MLIQKILILLMTTIMNEMVEISSHIPMTTLVAKQLRWQPMQWKVIYLHTLEPSQVAPPSGCIPFPTPGDLPCS